MQLASGTIIDERYEIHSVIGVGGFGVVYIAKHLALERLVALKVLQSKLDPEALARFEAEARALSALKHRNLVLFYGFGVWQESPYMALELVQGRNLQSLIEREKKLPVQKAIAIMSQICEALSVVHRNGIVHRDLKPSNIMVLDQSPGEVPQIKVIDFGLAKILPDSQLQLQRITEAGTTVGSAEYMSPEQCLGNEIDARSDLYSAGCVLFKCLTGCSPFIGEHSFSVMQQQLTGTPRPLSDFLPPGSYPVPLQHILNRALVKLPDLRYQSADEVLNDLEALQTMSGKRMVASAKDDASGLTFAAEQPSKIHKAAVMSARTIGGVWLLLAVSAIALTTTVIRLGPNSGTNRPRIDAPRHGSSLACMRTAREFDLGFDSYREDSLNLYQRALNLNTTDHLLSVADVALIEGRIADICLKKDNYGTAQEWQEKAVSHDLQIGAPSPSARDHFTTLGQIYLSMKQPDEGAARVQQLYTWWIDKAGRPDEQLSEVLIECYKASHRPDKAKEIEARMKGTRK